MRIVGALLYICYATAADAKRKVQQVRGEKKKNAIDNDSILYDSLPTAGFCWIHENGKFCFEEDRFQSISTMGDELFYEEFFDGKKFSYTRQHTEKLRDNFSSSMPKIQNKKLAHALSDTSWLDANDTKYRCMVKEEKGFHFDAKDKKLMRRNGDNSSFWSFSHDWVVTADSRMIPITFQGNNGSDLIASIQGVERMSSKIAGCDPDKEGNEAPDISPAAHKRYLRILDAHDPSISEDEYFSEEGQSRRLDWITDLQGEISNTQWCGAGTDHDNTPCPNPDLSYDFFADQACRRHDHGALSVTTAIALPRMECYVDKELVDLGGHNFAVQAAYGTFGAMGYIVGCYNYVAYNCFYWQGWSLKYGYCGHQWDINYGPWRYDNAVNEEGYSTPSQTCDYDYMLW